MGIYDLWPWLAGLRAETETARRDRERRIYQANREGFRHSGEPSPVPIYHGPPAPGARLTGVESEYVIGNGANVAIDLITEAHRTWVYHAVSISVAGTVSHIDKDYYIVALNGSVSLGVIAVSEHAVGPTVTHQDVNYARIPATTLRLVVPGSTVATLYVLTAIWEADR